MTKYLSIVAGACVFAAIGFLCASGLSLFFEQQFAKSQDDMDSFAVILVLFFIPLFSAVGGVLGFSMHKHLTVRSKGRADKRRAPEL
jgi:O-antigen/teichoic acid export membrane protein